jgi:hypothetical protein
MGMAETAKNQNFHEIIDSKPEGYSFKIDENRLTDNERAQLKSKQTYIKDLAAKRTQLLSQGKNELTKLATTLEENAPFITLKEQKELEKALEDEHSPEKIQKKLDQIKEIPDQKRKEREKGKDDEKELPPDHKDLVALERQFRDLCTQNTKYIGEGQVVEYQRWFAQEKSTHPTKKHLKGLIEDFEGKDYPHPDGLAPRKEEFQKQTKLFQKFGLPNPLESEYIKREGLSERKEFRENAESLAAHFDKLKDTGFYSPEMIKKSMQTILKAKRPLDQKEQLQRAKNIARKEAEGFVQLNENMTVGGVTIRKMSKRSKELYLDYYKNSEFQERAHMVEDWKGLVDNEAKLAKDLEGIYGADKDGLVLALKSFAELDYISKESALKEHKNLVNSNLEKSEKDKILTIKAAETAIKQSPYLSDKTKVKYVAYFKTEANYPNPKTGKVGDSEVLKERYETLVSSKPDGDSRNLAAYKHYYERHKTRIAELKEINPNISDKELKKWQEDYDKESWTNRKKIHADLKEKISEQILEKKKKTKLEAAAGIDSEDSNESKEGQLKLEETIKVATELMNNGQGAEAMKLLLEFNSQEPDNPKILFWMETVAKYMKEFGTGAKKQDTMDEKISDEMDEIFNDETIADKLEEQQIKHHNIHGAKLSEKKHDNSISAEERAKKESLKQTKTDSIEEDLTKDFYDVKDGFILNDEGTGEKITKIKMGEDMLKTREQTSLRSNTFHNQNKLDKNIGFANVELKDEKGRTISAKEATTIEAKATESLEEIVATNAQKQVEQKTGNVFDLSSRIAAQRKAKEEIEERKNKKLKNAA